MYYIEVIHIPSVVPYLESSFYHVVKLVQIDIAEELTGEVADRQSDALWLAKQALGRWQLLSSQTPMVRKNRYHIAVLTFMMILKGLIFVISCLLSPFYSSCLSGMLG